MGEKENKCIINISVFRNFTPQSSTAKRLVDWQRNRLNLTLSYQMTVVFFPPSFIYFLWPLALHQVAKVIRSRQTQQIPNSAWTLCKLTEPFSARDSNPQPSGCGASMQIAILLLYSGSWTHSSWLEWVQQRKNSVVNYGCAAFKVQWITQSQSVVDPFARLLEPRGRYKSTACSPSSATVLLHKDKPPRLCRYYWRRRHPCHLDSGDEFFWQMVMSTGEGAEPEKAQETFVLVANYHWLKSRKQELVLLTWFQQFKCKIYR